MKPLTGSCIALLAALLAACGSSPPVRYYSLEPAILSASGEERGATVVGFGPLRVPEYLKRSQIVTRADGAEVEVHEYARWAEPVEKALHRVVAANVDSRLDGVVVIAYPFLEPVAMQYMVLGQIDRFDSDRSGNVTLQVQWAVVGDGRTSLIPPRRARYESRAANADDPGAIARAMNEALNRFSEDIAAQLSAALQAP